MILSIFYIFLKNSYFFADVNVTRVIHSRSLLKKSNVICLFFLEQIAHLLSKTPCSSLLFPFLSSFMPKNESLLSLFALLLFLKSNRSESLSSLFKKEWPGTNCSHCSLKKSDKSDSLFENSDLLFRSFPHKKLALPSKNQRAKSQPWWKFLQRWALVSKEQILIFESVSCLFTKIREFDFLYIFICRHRV